MTQRPLLLFVSTRFLFPIDSGGKIRTTQVLRGLKGGAFRVRLMSPATAGETRRFSAEIEDVCDEFVPWAASERGALFQWTRLRHLPGPLPVPVRTDATREAIEAVRREIGRRPDVAVFDFAHAAVLAPKNMTCPSVMFTHNVEAEIFGRHAEVSANPAVRAVWRNQHAKMLRFEKQSLGRFDCVTAVSARDADVFRKQYGIANVAVMPTGVDLDYFAYGPPDRVRDITFCGSMDWMANQDAMTFFMEDIWPRIAAAEPELQLTVVGRAPPEKMVRDAADRGYRWRFTGFVDDVRPDLRGAAVSIIPLRVGGGTRLKAYEAMAIGSPLVSTSVGIEGLPVTPGVDCLVEDDPAAFADAVVRLVRNESLRLDISRRARRFVEDECSFRKAAKVFENACLAALHEDGAKSRRAWQGVR